MVTLRKLTWKPKRVPIRTTVPLKEGYLGFHVSLGECTLRLIGARGMLTKFALTFQVKDTGFGSGREGAS